ncbi:hypothetical protein R3P38DRAFT_2905072 [Favolaschia claudopus]|uniref:NAD(P)-binding protein n=1 Tax=Favolaschia claudopus TaxID=2862362 RepID=A0AAW0CDV0_9AGAR
MAETKKSVLITGCSIGGIGFSLAKEFHAKGYRVFATSRRLEPMEQLNAMGIETLILNVTDIAAIRKVKEEISAKTGGTLDILINNAGIGSYSSVMDEDMSDVRSCYETNVFAPMSMVQEFLPLLMACGKTRPACIANNASIAGIVPVPFGSTYNSTKAALLHWSDTLAIEVAPFNIRVVNLLTGAVKSNILQPYTFPVNSPYTPFQELHRSRIIEQDKTGMDTDKFASVVVAELVKSNPPAWLWKGKESTFVWLVSTFLPRSWVSGMLWRMFGFPKFAADWKNGKKRD